MVTVTCKTAYWRGAGYNNYSTLTTETRFLFYNWRHRFFRPADVVVTLDDAGGVSSQKYKVDVGASPTTAYLGSGWLTIEEDGTKILDLRILDALPDFEKGTLTLMCQDWMSQLAESPIQYDTREDLGSGLRESTVTRIASNSGVAHVYTSGSTYYLYDNGKAWTTDAFVGKRVLFSGKMGGSQSFTVHARDETVTAGESAPMETDTPANGEDNVYADDDTSHVTENNGVWDVQYEFLAMGPKSALVTAWKGLAVKIKLKLELETNPDPNQLINIQWRYYYNYPPYLQQVVGSMEWRPSGSPRTLLDGTYTIDIIPDQYFFDSDGVAKFIIRVFCGYTPNFATLKLTVDRIWCIVDCDCIADSNAYAISANTSNRLTVDQDLTVAGKGIWEGAPYAVCKKITDHVNPLVTAHDPLKTLATSVEDLSYYMARHHSEEHPLEILTEWAKDLGAVLWCYLDGSGNPTVKLQATWTAPGGTPTNLNDSNVLLWEPRREWSPVANEYHVSGIRASGNSQVYVDTSDLSPDPGVDSKEVFGLTRTKAFSNQNIYTAKDATEVGRVLVERDEDIQLVLVAHIAGRKVNGSADLRLGDYVTITSSYLGLSAVGYWIIEHSYDMQMDETKYVLHPDVASDKFLDASLLPHLLRAVDFGIWQARQANRQIYPAPSWSETW